jgi:small subunit ribosomal protein S17
MSDETTPEETTEQVDAVTEEPAAEAAPEATPEIPAEPEEILHPKERRRRTRSAHDGTTRTARTPEERHAERQEARAKKAVARRRRRLQEREKFVAKREQTGPLPTKEPADATPGNPKVRQGVVVSSKADKTITVRVDTARRHRRYEKIVRSSSTLHAHDERNDAGEGDTVQIIECRPLSRTKRWRLVEILERAK